MQWTNKYTIFSGALFWLWPHLAPPGLPSGLLAFSNSFQILKTSAVPDTWFYMSIDLRKPALRCMSAVPEIWFFHPHAYIHAYTMVFRTQASRAHQSFLNHLGVPKDLGKANVAIWRGSSNISPLRLSFSLFGIAYESARAKPISSRRAQMSAPTWRHCKYVLI